MEAGERAVKDIPVVILCGGKGMRLGGGITDVPKPLVDVGGMPILWHVMRIYASDGFKRFILCLGFKGGMIRSWFAEHVEAWAGWEVIFVDTGLDTETGGRVKQIEQYVNGEPFFVSYADGVSDVSISKLLVEHFHGHRGVATMTCVQPRTHYGIVRTVGDLVVAYEEKQRLGEWVNGGFFCFDYEMFKYIQGNEALEREPMQRLIKDKQLTTYKHNGFWACMDTPKDHQVLNEMWTKGEAPWRR